MTHELRRLLEEELAGETPPPLGDVVRVSVDSGRRVRRRRRLLAGAGGGATAAVLAVAGLLAVGTTTTSSGPSAEPPPPAMSAAGTVEPAVSGWPGRCAVPARPVPDDPAGPFWVVVCADTVAKLDLTVPEVTKAGWDGAGDTTPAGALELLVRLLPKSTIVDYAYRPPTGLDPEPLSVEAYADRGDGFGTVRLLLAQTGPVRAEPDSELCRAALGCAEIPGAGLLIVRSDPAECPVLDSVTLHRPDGITVALEGTGCRYDGDRRDRPAEAALSVQDAVTVVLNPMWGPQLPLELIRAGEANFPEPNSTVGG